MVSSRQKDVVNLGGLQSALAPLAVPRVTIEVADAEDAVSAILRRIDERKPRT